MVAHGLWNGVSGYKGLRDMALSVSLYGNDDVCLPFDLIFHSLSECFVEN